jgi:hypothetical protein
MHQHVEKNCVVKTKEDVKTKTQLPSAQKYPSLKKELEKVQYPKNA